MQTIIQNLKTLLRCTLLSSPSGEGSGVRSRLGIGLLLGLGLVSCSENIEPALPAGGNIAYVNFVNMGEAFLYGAADTLYRDNRLYINDSTGNAPFDNYNDRSVYPIVFTSESGVDIRQYPRHLTGISAVIDHRSGDIYWLPVHAGAYRFIFTSRDRTYLHTEHATLQKETYQALYLVESPETDSSYTVVSVPVEWNDRVEGSVTVQFVNLSPDAGEVEAYRVDAGGNETLTATPAPLAFGQYGTAVLSTEGSQSTYNSILLRFRTPSGGDLQSVAVPAENGAVYTVLLRGFDNPAERKIKKNNNEMAAVSILPDLRCSVRRVFY